MNKFLALVCFGIFSVAGYSQVVINELDCDTPGVDTQEFIELKSDTPNFALDGYVVVMFNGSASGGNTSYVALDLDGYQTDINGLLLIGSNSVSPVPQYLISENVIQNGADAIAIYQADDFDFLQGTLATIENLVDVLIYGTADPDATGLIDIFNDHPNFTTIQQIDEGPGNNTNSIQRNNDGTYFVAVPTPRQLNDGSGVVLNGVSVSVPQTQYNEGDSFTITFTTEQVLTEDLNLNVSLNFGTFDTNDFMGTLALTIPSGQNSISTSINLIDDSDDEGDEQLRISMGALPPTYLPLNNNLIVRVVDNDYTVAPFGTPLNPTFGVVSSTQPNGYYDSLDGLSDASLKQALQDIIANPSIVRAQTYNDVTDILKQADQNPANSNQVWLVYLEQGRAKLDFQTTASNMGTWNREHVFPRSRGGYDSIEADETADGIDVFWTTNADSLRHGNSDAHHIRAVDGPENSARGNLFYGQYTGPSGTAGMFRGDVARSIFYMAVRYNGLEVVNGYPEGNVGQFGDLATLLLWHQNDPPDDFEMNRNNVVYNWQFNRNPFIDEPELVDYLWGDMVGQVWDANLSIDDNLLSQIKIFPNPASNYIHVRGVNAETKMELYTMEGKLIDEKHFNTDTRLELHLASGMYLVKLFRQDQVSVSKLIIK